MVLLVNMHLIKGTYFPMWPGWVQGNSDGPLAPMVRAYRTRNIHNNYYRVSTLCQSEIVSHRWFIERGIFIITISAFLLCVWNEEYTRHVCISTSLYSPIEPLEWHHFLLVPIEPLVPMDHLNCAVSSQVTWENNLSPLNEMHIHQWNHWNDISFYWYQLYHWYHWTIGLTNRIRLCILDMCDVL